MRISEKNGQVRLTSGRAPKRRQPSHALGRCVLPTFALPNALRHAYGASLAALMLLAASLLFVGRANATPNCDSLGYNLFPQNKINKLYLYFPPADDSTFPDVRFPQDPSTPAAHKFDVTELTSYMTASPATGPDLMSQIFDVVSDDFCEFNVQVVNTTACPPQTFARRNTVAIGTDSMTDADAADQFGQAQGPDTADQTAVDFARVWAGTY